AFEGRQQVEMGSQRRERFGEAMEFFGVIEGGKLSRENSYPGSVPELMRKQFGGNSSAYISMRHDRSHAIRIRSIAAYAHHGRPAARELANQRGKSAQVAGKKNDAVVATCNGTLEGLHITNAETRILMEFEMDLHADSRSGCGADAGPQRIKEIGNMFRQDDRNRKPPVQL